MAIHYRTSGIILKKVPEGEANQLFTVYTKDFGKLEILGKAIRKIKSKLRAGAELFYLSEIEFIQGKTYKTLTDAVLIDKFKNIRKSLERLKIACQISEVFDVFVKGQEKDEKLWVFLNAIFSKLNDYSPPFLFYCYFFWNLVAILGYEPQLYNCAVCQKKLVPEPLYFSPKEGGVICNQCQKLVKSSKSITVEAVKILRILLGRKGISLNRLKVEKNDLNSLKVIYDYFLSEMLPQKNLKDV